MFRTGVAALALAIAVPFTAASAQDAAGFQAYLPTLAQQVAAAGVTRRTIDAVVPTLVYNARVVELDRQQPESSPNAPIPAFAPYRARHVDADRVARGRAAYQRARGRLSAIEQQTGVPESIMVAIWGHETNYGRVMGGFDLPRALASLAYEGRRRALFTDEFIATLKMIDRGVPRDKLVGSWAGAFGGRNSSPASIYVSRATAMATASPTSGAATPIRWRRSGPISSMPGGAPGSPGGLPSRYPLRSIAA